VRVLAASWLTSFRPFTTFHLVVAIVCIAATVVACRVGVRRRGSPFEPWFRRGWALFTVLVQAEAWWWFSRPERFDPGWTLPLHLCSIVVWIAPVALVFEWRTPRALLYFWGFGLCMQGLVTPLPQDGLLAPAFWFFWFGHLAIVGSASYLVIALRYRPTLRDLGTAVAASLLYVAVVVPLDLAFGWNYGFLGRRPLATRNVLDLLGPWPWRPAFTVLIGLLVLWVLWAIWQVPPLRRVKPALPRPAA